MTVSKILCTFNLSSLQVNLALIILLSAKDYISYCCQFRINFILLFLVLHLYLVFIFYYFCWVFVTVPMTLHCKTLLHVGDGQWMPLYIGLPCYKTENLTMDTMRVACLESATYLERNKPPYVEYENEQDHYYRYKRVVFLSLFN